MRIAMIWLAAAFAVVAFAAPIQKREAVDEQNVDASTEGNLRRSFPRIKERDAPEEQNADIEGRLGRRGIWQETSIEMEGHLIKPRAGDIYQEESIETEAMLGKRKIPRDINQDQSIEAEGHLIKIRAGDAYQEESVETEAILG